METFAWSSPPEDKTGNNGTRSRDTETEGNEKLTCGCFVGQNKWKGKCVDNPASHEGERQPGSCWAGRRGTHCGSQHVNKAPWRGSRVTGNLPALTFSTERPLWEGACMAMQEPLTQVPCEMWPRKRFISSSPSR